MRGLDNWITGNYGEDQFKGEAEWERFVTKSCLSCVFHQLNQCPISDPDEYDVRCLVIKTRLAEKERIEQEIEDALDKEMDKLRMEEELN